MLWTPVWSQEGDWEGRGYWELLGLLGGGWLLHSEFCRHNFIFQISTRTDSIWSLHLSSGQWCETWGSINVSQIDCVKVTYCQVTRCYENTASTKDLGKVNEFNGERENVIRNGFFPCQIARWHRVSILVFLHSMSPILDPVAKPIISNLLMIRVAFWIPPFPSSIMIFCNWVTTICTRSPKPLLRPAFWRLSPSNFCQALKTQVSIVMIW